MIDNHHSVNDVTLAQFLGSDRTAVHSNISMDIVTRKGDVLTNPKTVAVNFLAGLRPWLCWIFGLGIIRLFLVLIARSELRKEAARYSLACTQLAVWTAVIMILYTSFYLVLLSSPVVNTTVLAFGTSVPNTVLAGTRPATHKLVGGGGGPKGFMFEIPNDASDVTIHRLQHFLFTLVFVTISQSIHAEFSTTQLKGISTAAYSRVKLFDER